MKPLIALTLLLFSSPSIAVKFNSYVNEKGEKVFSNVPAECIQNSTLTCLQYHPAISARSQTSPKPANPANNHSPRGKTMRPMPASSSSTDLGSEMQNLGNILPLDILERLVEMNDLMNEYYSAAPDPADASRVRQQQDKILNVLGVIKNTASSEEKSSIQRAIDILRSNLIQ